MEGDDRTVANPNRTQVDDDEELRPDGDEQDERTDEPRPAHRTRKRHDEPWPAVAREVKQAEEP